MLVTLTLEDGSRLVWQLKSHSAIDKLVSALKENEPSWKDIVIQITKSPVE